jgi:hypothetical protein
MDRFRHVSVLNTRSRAVFAMDHHRIRSRVLFQTRAPGRTLACYDRSESECSSSVYNHPRESCDRLHRALSWRANGAPVTDRVVGTYRRSGHVATHPQPPNPRSPPGGNPPPAWGKDRIGANHHVDGALSRGFAPEFALAMAGSFHVFTLPAYTSRDSFRAYVAAETLRTVDRFLDCCLGYFTLPKDLVRMRLL